MIVSRWVEFKAIVPNLKTIETKARGFEAEFLHERREQDTHFKYPDGLLLLRKFDHQPAELITLQRGVHESFRISEVEIAEVQDAREVSAMLRGRFGVSVEIEKTRKVFIWRETRIHLDQVDRLGMFVELVTEVDSGDEARAAIELREALVRLGMEHMPLEDRGYAEQMLEKGKEE